MRETHFYCCELQLASRSNPSFKPEQTEGFAPGLRPFHAALLKTIHRIVLPASPSERFESLLFICTKKRDAFQASRFFVRADGGIRTLVTRRSNAFRVRPVMTASIRLHVYRALSYPTILIKSYDDFPILPNLLSVLQ